MDTRAKDNRTDDDKSILRAAKANLSETVVEAKRKLLGDKKEPKEAYEMIFSVLSVDKEKLGGENSIFLLPGLLVIAETHIVEERSKKAQEYLTAAYWNFLKHNKPDDKSSSLGDLTREEFNQYKTNLHRTFAKLYKLKGEYEESIKEIQNAVYIDSCSYGPEHPKTTVNYYLLGKIFEESGKEQQAEAFYAKVAEIWYKYLKSYLRLSVEEQQMYQFDSLILQEALELLKQIELYFAQKYQDGDSSQNLFVPIMRVEYSIGLLYKIFGQNQNCRERLKKVYKRCQALLPEDDENTVGVKEDLEDLAPDYEGMEDESQNYEMSPNHLLDSQRDSDGYQEHSFQQKGLREQEQQPSYLNENSLAEGEERENNQGDGGENNQQGDEQAHEENLDQPTENQEQHFDAQHNDEQQSQHNSDSDAQQAPQPPALPQQGQTQLADQIPDQNPDKDTPLPQPND